MEIRISPDGARYAIRTGPSVTLPWFVGNPDAGGAYGSGNEAADWQPMIPDPDWVVPSASEEPAIEVPDPAAAPEFRAGESPPPPK